MKQEVTTKLESAFDQLEAVETRVTTMPASFNTSKPILIEAAATEDKLHAVVTHSHDSTSNDRVVPAMIPVTSQSKGCRQALVTGSKLLNTDRSGVYFKNVEVTRFVHPLQACSLDGPKDTSKLKKVTVGRPLPPAPALLKAGRSIRSPSTKAVAMKLMTSKPRTSSGSRMSLKPRASKPTSVAAIHKKVKNIVVKGKRVKKRYNLSSDEQVFLEAATALSNRKLKLVEAREDEIVPQKPPLTSLAMSPPPFSLCYSH